MWLDWLVCFRVEDLYKAFSNIRITCGYLSDSRWYKPLALRCSSADWAGNARQDEAQRALRGLLGCIPCASIPSAWRSQRTFGFCWPVCGLWRGRTFPCLNACAEEGACHWSTPVKACSSTAQGSGGQFPWASGENSLENGGLAPSWNCQSFGFAH